MNLKLRIVVFLLLAWAAPAMARERRVALIIGNERYRNINALSNPAHDAEIIAASARAAGFELVGGKPLLNADKKSIEAAVRSFGQALRGGAVAMFYYSGHGVQVGDRNYLVPVDAAPNSASEVDFELVNVDLVMRQVANGGGRLSMIILDACRTNPLSGGGSRAAGGGLAAMDAPQGTIISYATAPGKTAADGKPGTNSPYAAALAKAMRQPGVGVLDVFNEVGVDVDTASGGKQQPWLAVSPLRGRFYFTPGEATEAPLVAAAAPVQVPTPAPLQAPPPTPQGSGVPFVSAMLGIGQAPSVANEVGGGVSLILKRAEAAEQRKDYDQALKLYREAAAQGNAQGQFNVGYFYRKGYAVEADPVIAAKWYRQAADQGYATAQNNLGFLYAEGEGVDRDYAMARKLYTLAAEVGQDAEVFDRQGAAVLAHDADLLRRQGGALFLEHPALHYRRDRVRMNEFARGAPEELAWIAHAEVPGHGRVRELDQIVDRDGDAVG